MKEARYHKHRLANHVLHPETLMLGYGYMRRAMARRAREKAEMLAVAAQRAGTQLPR